MNRKSFIQAAVLGAVGLLLGTATQKALAAPKETVVSCLGDSTTWGCNGIGQNDDWGGPEISWPKKIKALLGLAEVYNFGISGSQLAISADRQDSFCERIDAVLEHPADIFLVMGGVNDFLHNIPIGKFSDRDQHCVYGALHFIVQKISAQYPESQIIFMTPLKCDYVWEGKHWPSSREKNALQLTQADYVEAIRNVCDYYSLPIIDLYAGSGISPFLPGQRERYMPDGLHYNEDGYARLAAHIAGELQRFLL